MNNYAEARLGSSHSFKIIMTNGLYHVPLNGLEKVDEVVIETPLDLSFVTQDIWREKICFLLKNHCYSYTAYGQHSDQLHDIIDDIAFDDYPLMDGQSFESNFDEICQTWDDIANNLVTVAHKEDIETLIYMALRAYDPDGLHRTVLFLKDLDHEQKWLVEFSTNDWRVASHRLLSEFFKGERSLLFQT